MKVRQLIRNTFLMVMAFFIPGQPAVCLAGDIPRTVRMDRIWEYTHTVASAFENISLAMERYRFTGREHVGGRDYYKFQRILYKEYRPNPDTGEYELVKEDYPENSKPYYMREKDGKVYYYTGAGQGRPDQTGKIDEWMVYDFNLVEGDSISLPTYPQQALTNPRTWLDYPIIESGEIEIGGEKSPYYVLYNKMGLHYNDKKCIAGIGVVEYGFLPEIEILETTGTGPKSYMDLSQVYNEDYEVLFRGEMTFDEILGMYPGAGVSSTHMRSPAISYESGILEVGCVGEEIHLEVFTADGRKTLSRFGKDECRLELDHLTPGVYLAKATTSSGSRTLRILI